MWTREILIDACIDWANGREEGKKKKVKSSYRKAAMMVYKSVKAQVERCKYLLENAERNWVMAGVKKDKKNQRPPVLEIPSRLE